jgi:hypothetical protein
MRPADPQVVAELRDLFRKGATPSRLIRHIIHRHAGQSGVDVLVRAYFREAFGVPMLRFDLGALEREPEDLVLATLNAQVIPRMLATRPEWDTLPARDDASGLNWAQSLVPTDEAELIQRANPSSVPELARSWDRMDRETQNYIKRLVGNGQALHEKLLMLAQLAEQLQQQVMELEQRSALTEPRSSHAEASSSAR